MRLDNFVVLTRFQIENLNGHSHLFVISKKSKYCQMSIIVTAGYQISFEISDELRNAVHQWKNANDCD